MQFSVLDASSKFPVGLMKGNILNVGNYDECLQVEVKEDWGSFIGQHCMATIDIPTNIFPTGYISNLEVTNLFTEYLIIVHISHVFKK